MADKSNGESKGRVIPPPVQPSRPAVQTAPVRTAQTATEPARPPINREALRRNKPPAPEPEPEPPPVSAGAVDKVIDYAFNPTREKIREMTIVDRIQGRLFPLLDMINHGTHYVLEIAAYRQDADNYEKTFKRKRPIPPDLIEEFMFRTAQWQKSVAGINLAKATDIALAEKEGENKDDEDFGGADNYFGKE